MEMSPLRSDVFRLRSGAAACRYCCSSSSSTAMARVESSTVRTRGGVDRFTYGWSLDVPTSRSSDKCLNCSRAPMSWLSPESRNSGQNKAKFSSDSNK